MHLACNMQYANLPYCNSSITLCSACTACKMLDADCALFEIDVLTSLGLFANM